VTDTVEEPTRIDLEERLQLLSKLAQRYSIKDPRYIEAHHQMDEALTAWELVRVVDG
jgi:hypothetical protein